MEPLYPVPTKKEQRKLQPLRTTSKILPHESSPVIRFSRVNGSYGYSKGSSRKNPGNINEKATESLMDYNNCLFYRRNKQFIRLLTDK